MYASKEFIFSFIAITSLIILSAISTAIPYWLSYDVTERHVRTYINWGLWYACGNPYGKNECHSLTEVPNYLNVTRGLMLSGTMMFGFSLFHVLKYASNLSSKCMANMCMISLVLGATLLPAAMVVYAKNTTDAIGSHGSAFYLPIPTSVLAIITAYIVNRAKRSQVSYGYNRIDYETVKTSF